MGATDSKGYYFEGGRYEFSYECWEWFDNEGKIHRDDDKPARLYKSGTKHWYKHGLKHRDNAPAVIYSDGSYRWFNHGKEHNVNGFAVFHSHGDRSLGLWYIDGIQYHSREKFEEASDAYCKEHNIPISGRLTKRANPDA